MDYVQEYRVENLNLLQNLWQKAQVDAKEGDAMSLVKLERDRALWVAASWQNDFSGLVLSTSSKIIPSH